MREGKRPLSLHAMVEAVSWHFLWHGIPCFAASPAAKSGHEKIRQMVADKPAHPRSAAAEIEDLTGLRYLRFGATRQ